LTTNRQDRPHQLAAAADQVTKETLTMLRGMAREHDDQGQNVAAVALAHRLLSLAPELLANSLANVLLDQVRTNDAQAQLDGDLTGVEVRLIGPEDNARAVLAKMAAAGIPTNETSDALEAVERPGTKRFYTYTDNSTRSAIRRARNSGHRRGAGRPRP
jgi:hypothetical protein